MLSLRPRARSRQVWLILFLVVALMASQWIGVMHRVAHSGLIHTSDESLSHSCAALDAATLGHAMVPAAIVIPALAAQFEIAQRIAFRSWSVPFFPCFSSRAPPAI